MPVVVFTNQKGGVGKSTLSVLFSQWLREKQGRSVAFVDLDMQGNSSKTLGRWASRVPAAALFHQEEVDLGIEAPTEWLFGASKELADLELKKAEVIIPSFRNQIRRVQDRCDWIVIDTPPALGLRMTAALIAADEVVCPIELEEYSVDGLTDMLKTIFGIQRRYNPPLHLAGVVANRFNPHSVRQKTVLHDLVSHYSEFFIPAKISTRSAIPEALALGQSLWTLPKSSAREASLEVIKVCELLHERMTVRSVATALEDTP